MESIILALHIVVCVLLVILILLQSGKEGMGVIFGGGNTSVFGSSGAGSYTYVTSRHETKDSAVLNVRIEDQAPAAPAAPAAPSAPAAPAAPAEPAPAGK